MKQLKHLLFYHFSDSKGREILVPYNKISYVEVGEGADRRVGFASQ